MGKHDKILAAVVGGRADHNIAFDDLLGLLDALGFYQRVRGSHHIFWHNGMTEILNVQPRDGKAKAYQVKQVRDIVLRYRMEIGQ